MTKIVSWKQTLLFIDRLCTIFLCSARLLIQTKSKANTVFYNNQTSFELFQWYLGKLKRFLTTNSEVSEFVSSINRKL